MTWAALYIIVACFFAPFTCRSAMNWLQDDYGPLSVGETVLCLVIGVIGALLWPILVAAKLIQRVRG